MEAKPKKPFDTQEDARYCFLSKQVPFSHFVENYFKSIKYQEMPPILDIIQPALFGKEANTQ
jgi:hypothetical protein